MKQRLRLSESEALHLGFTPKQSKSGNPKYILNKKQVKELAKLRVNEIDNLVKDTITETNQYNHKFILSALKDNNIMDIDEYCNFYGLPRNDVNSYKLVTHTGTPFYNIAFKENEIFDDFDYIGELKKLLKDYKKNYKTYNKGKEGVITITDLHFGAYISAMLKTPEFNITILVDMLEKSVEQINRFKYDVVHVHLLGDLIESFTGMNHKNSWKGLDKGMFGVNAVKLFVDIIHKHFLSKINNLSKIKVVAGNHDRVTSDNNEDVDGGAADLICWGLEFLNYDIEFNTSVITHTVEDVTYILTHGHHGISKNNTQTLCWDYGVKGNFNFVCEGHLHSRISKLNAKQIHGFKMIQDDSIDCRRQIFPSLFTGNTYSENGGWSTKPGFIITESNGNNGVNVLDFSI